MEAGDSASIGAVSSASGRPALLERTSVEGGGLPAGSIGTGSGSGGSGLGLRGAGRGGAGAVPCRRRRDPPFGEAGRCTGRRRPPCPVLPGRQGVSRAGRPWQGALSARTRSITPETSWGGGSHSPSWTRAPSSSSSSRAAARQAGHCSRWASSFRCSSGDRGPSRRRPIRSSARSQPDMPGHSFLCRSISIDAGESKKFPSSSKIFRRERRARAIRDFTVPRSRSRTWAISW